MKTNGFYQTNVEVLKFKVDKDQIKILFNHYISQKENIQRLSDELPRGYFKLTSKTVADDLNIPLTRAKKLVNEFEELGIIQSIFKSKTKYEPSIYCYVSVSKSEPVNEPVEKPVNEPVNEPVKCDNINGFDLSNEPVEKPVNEPVEKPVNEPSKKELLKKNNLKREYKKEKEKNSLSFNSQTIEITNNVIEHLNAIANKSHPIDNETLMMVKTLLDNKYSEQDIRNVITVKTNEWLNDIKMNSNLRPKTLFKINKFNDYLEEYKATQPPQDKAVGEVDFDLASLYD